MFYSVGSILRSSRLPPSWNTQLNMGAGEDNVWCLGRPQQVIIFRLSTDHCRLLSPLYKLKLPYAVERLRGNGTHTLEYILQSCQTDCPQPRKFKLTRRDGHKRLYRMTYNREGLRRSDIPETDSGLDPAERPDRLFRLAWHCAHFGRVFTV